MWGLATVAAFYWLVVKRYVGREMQCLRRRARSIPDPGLRARASFVLNDESWTVEGAAFFATLVPRSQVRTAVRLMIRFQALYLYLDGLGEEPNADPFANTAQLSKAILGALEAPPSEVPYYLHLHAHDDGGFLNDLVVSCRESLRALPSAAVALPVMQRMAIRNCECQSHTHAAPQAGSANLEAWSSEQDSEGAYTWWEVAAGSNNSISLHALFAAAADPRTTPVEANRVAAAYSPPTAP